MLSNEAEPEIIRSRFNRTVCIIVWAVSGVMLVSAIVGGEDAVLRSTPTIALIAFAAWLVLWQPNLVITDDGVTLRNVFRTITVPWGALIQVDTKYAMTLITPGHRFVAWVAPAPGALTSQRIARQSRKRGAEINGPELWVQDAGTLPGELAGTESGHAARRVRERWAKLIDTGRVATGQAVTVPVVTTWHTAQLIALGLLVGLSVAAALL